MPIPSPITTKGQAVRRQTTLESVIREFETYLSDGSPRPFSILRANDTNWTPAQRRALAPEGYPHKLTGIYVYIDVCTENDVSCLPANDDTRYSVIRYIGSATNSFYDETRKKHWMKDDDGEYRPRFSHRWIDIITIPADFGFIAIALEDFLLQRIRTTENKRRVPKRLLAEAPMIYDDSNDSLILRNSPETSSRIDGANRSATSDHPIR
jgi:hypothetical protein